MLLSVSLENLFCFRERATLSLQAAAGLDGETLESPFGPLVACAGLWGATASGRSSFVAAIAWARALVLEGTPQGASIAAPRFALDGASASRPAGVELELVAEGRRYQYAFSVTPGRVESERLHASSPGGQAALLFRRAPGDLELGAELARDPARAGALAPAARETRDAQLFLAEAAARGVPELAPLVRWFETVLFTVRPEHALEGVARLIGQHEPFRRAAGELLRRAGSGVCEVAVARRSPTPAEVDALAARLLRETSHDPEGLLAQEGRALLATMRRQAEAGALELRFNHGTPSAPRWLGLDAQSDGTRRLLGLSLYTHAPGRVLVIDELERGLHPLLARELLRDLARPPGQVIFTTNDASLLDHELVRRDGVWFVEKDAAGASRLSSLVEHEAAASEQRATDYLDGRFGAVPRP